MVSESSRRGKLLRSSANSATRVMKDRATVAAVLADSATRKNLKQVVRPNSISRTARKVGIALLLSPDPVTDVAAVVMFGVYIATKSKSPIGPSAVYEETQRILSEMDSLF